MGVLLCQCSYYDQHTHIPHVMVDTSELQKRHKAARSTKRRKVALSGTMALQWITYKIGFFAIFFSILSTIQEQAAAAGSRMRRKTAKISAAARSSNNYLTTKALNSPCNSE